ncbi:MAG: tetraacyldisaccharide 4'-kinase [Pseudobdellovibrionaceae bacterium]
MKTPTHWYSSPFYGPLAAWALSPFAFLYAFGARHHRAQASPRPVEIPVLCLGNLVAGGSGKTPTAIALRKILDQSKISLSPTFVTRGYKGSITGPERVDGSHDPCLWGDEALLLARHAPTFVARNRYDGAVAALSAGADCIILDDGFQNYSLHKTLSFCVIDGQMGFGNGQVIPSGPLREPLQDGLDRADAFILIGDDTRDVRAVLPPDKPVFTAQITPCAKDALPNVPYIGFCGIGFPDKFKSTLEKAGVTLAGWRSFADHHVYTIDDMTRLVGDALAHDARLVTTEKDYVRLPDFAKKSLIDVLPVEVVFDDPAAFIAFLKKYIPASS